MQKPDSVPCRFKSLAEVHQAFGLSKPLHPLISLVNSESPVASPEPTTACQPDPQQAHVLSFYKISYQPRLSGRFRYGQGHYDLGEGGLVFAAPGQVIGGAQEVEAGACAQVTLLVHPDLLVGYPLAKRIRQYGFFSYEAHEALHVSEPEKQVLLALFDSLEGS